MPRFSTIKNKEHIGHSPGSFFFRGKRRMKAPVLTLIDFDDEELEERRIDQIEEVAQYINKDTITWLNIDGLHDSALMEKVAETFDLSPLILEDVMNPYQRPKIEEHDNCIFIALQMLKYVNDSKKVDTEQVSIVMLKNLLITFQEKKGDVFDPIRERIRNQKKRIRHSGVDYLAYALTDVVIDNYVDIIGRIGDEIEDIEEKIADSNMDEGLIRYINSYKVEINFLRKIIRPTRMLISQFQKIESELIDKQTLPFLRDLDDHIVLALETTESYREILSDQLNIYHTTLSSKMNDVMRVLTIFSAVFIPLTFIAGIYGTNFKYLPELEYRYAYFIMLGVMTVMALSMLWYFKKKKWL